MIFEKSNASLLEEYNSRVYGHETAKKALLTLVNRSKMRHYQKYSLNVPENELLEPCKLLLIGGSGTGKTFLVEQLRDMLDFPLLCLDATQLAPGSGKDGITQQNFKKLCVETVQEWSAQRRKKGYTISLEGAESQLVVFIDEMDKLATSFESSGNWNKHIQNSFLSMFDNHDDGAGVSFIFSGAFAGMEPKVANSIGFNKVENTDVVLLDDDIVRYGLIPEFVGRLTSITKLDVFNEKDYRHILYDTLLPKKQLGLSFFNGASLDVSDGEISGLIDRALKSGQGVRYLKRQLDAMALEAEFSYEDNNNTTVRTSL